MEKKKINVDEIVKNFEEKLNNGKSENLLNYLKFISNFHNYSFNNTILIYCQYPTATRCASFVTWKKLGYSVSKGSKAIKIVIPKVVKYIEDSEGNKIFFSQMSKEQREKIKNYKTFTTFDEGSVFDISQTVKINGSIESDQFFKALGNDFEEQFYTLKTLIENNTGVEVEFGNSGTAEGYAVQGKILLKKNDYNNLLLTLIHEFAHQIMHFNCLNNAELSVSREETTTNIRELQAESVSYVVSNYLGLENPFSTDYVLNWSNKDQFIKELPLIKKVSSFILDLIKEHNTNKENSNIAV